MDQLNGKADVVDVIFTTPAFFDRAAGFGQSRNIGVSFRILFALSTTRLRRFRDGRPGLSHAMAYVRKQGQVGLSKEKRKSDIGYNATPNHLVAKVAIMYGTMIRSANQYISLMHNRFSPAGMNMIAVLWMSLFTCWLKAQPCSCSLAEVQSNSVAPCDVTIGTVVHVNSASAFRNAINQANASGGNMTILIADGTYEIASPVSYPYITASNLVIRSASGIRDNVMLHGAGMQDVDPATENGLGIAGNNVTIADLTIRDVGNHGIQVSGHHLLVHNVRIQNTYQQMLKGATSDASIDSAIVQCSLFEYTDATGPNFYIGGLDIHKGNGWLVRDNVFKDIISPSGSVAEHAIHFWNNSQHNIIERNLIINCDRGIGFGLGNSPNTGGMIRNNMIYNNGAGPFHDVGIGLETSPGTKVYNNTIFITYQNAIEYRFTNTTDVHIANNLTNQLIRSRDGGSALVESNVTDAQSGWFVNPAEGDLHLVEGVIMEGLLLTADVPDDIDQTARYQGDSFEIGADEVLATSMQNDWGAALRIFPNPNAGTFTIAGFPDPPHSGQIEIFNTIGQPLRFELRCAYDDCILDILDKVYGTCFLRIVNPGNTLVHAIYLSSFTR